jgi:hypothetical protein
MSGTGSIWGHASVYQPLPEPPPDVGAVVLQATHR